MKIANLGLIELEIGKDILQHADDVIFRDFTVCSCQDPPAKIAG